MTTGVTIFCLHDWTIPSYNVELNLSEGLKKCSKCRSVKGYTRNQLRSAEERDERLDTYVPFVRYDPGMFIKTASSTGPR